MRLLIVHNRYVQRGGEDQVVDDEIALLRRHGHEVDTLLADNAELAELPTWQGGLQMLWSHAAAAQVRQRCAHFRPQLMHLHNSFARLSPSVIWAARACGVPVVQTLHNYRLFCANGLLLREGRPCEDCLGRSPWRGLRHACVRGALAPSAAVVGMIGLHRLLGSHVRHVARFIALSEHARGKLIAGGLPAERVVVKPNFVDDPRAAAGGADVAAAHAAESSAANMAESAADDPPNPQIQATRSGLLHVGRLSPEKGLEWLMQASAQAQCRVSLIGSGPLDAACRAHPWFDMLGQRSPAQVMAAMSRARALVVPSLGYEAMPRVLVEAMACGLPIIASRLGALAELVQHGHNGWLVEPGNTGALAATLRDLSRKCGFATFLDPRGGRPAPAGLGALTTSGTQCATHDAHWLACSAAARATYEAHYTAAAAHDNLLRIYAQALDVAGVGAGAGTGAQGGTR